MARRMIGPSDRERELHKHVARRWGMAEQERSYKRFGLVAALAVVLGLVLLVSAIALQDEVEERYAIIWSASPDLFMGQLELSEGGWEYLEEATFTLHFSIPDWDVEETRELVYYSTDVGGKQADYLRLGPLSGQVIEESSRREVDFTISIEIDSPHPEVKGLKLLGDSNTIRGTVTSHPDKDAVELTEAGRDVELDQGSVIKVRNQPSILGIGPWEVSFARNRFT